MKKVFFLGLMSLTVAAAQAKSFKVGPTSAADVMDFASINDAMNSSDVTDGDTLWLDNQYTETNSQTVSKSVVIIGNGYDSSQQVATLSSYIYLRADNIILSGIKCISIYFYNSNCLVDRCYTNYISSSSTGNNCIRSSYIMNYISGNNKAINLYNNVICSSYNHNITNMSNADIQYNTIICTGGYDYYSFYNVNNSNIQNNIILRNASSSCYGYILSNCSNNTIDHNVLSSSSELTGYPNNKIGYGGKSSEIFKCTGTFSDYYILADNSPALGYATDGGEVGCHGGVFGNPSTGRPQYVPYFSNVIVGSKPVNDKLHVSFNVTIEEK